MTKLTNYLATVTDVNSTFSAKGAAVPNSERCVIKDETSQTAGSVGAINNWNIDPTVEPLASYTNARLPRWQDLTPLDCNFTFSVEKVNTCTSPLEIDDWNLTGNLTVPRLSWQKYTIDIAPLILASYPQKYVISAVGTLLPFTTYTMEYGVQPFFPYQYSFNVQWNNTISGVHNISVTATNCGIYTSTRTLSITLT